MPFDKTIICGMFTVIVGSHILQWCKILDDTQVKETFYTTKCKQVPVYLSDTTVCWKFYKLHFV